VLVTGGWHRAWQVVDYSGTQIAVETLRRIRAVAVASVDIVGDV
jgi:hypothetical protein